MLCSTNATQTTHSILICMHWMTIYDMYGYVTHVLTGFSLLLWMPRAKNIPHRAAPTHRMHQPEHTYTYIYLQITNPLCSLVTPYTSHMWCSSHCVCLQPIHYIYQNAHKPPPVEALFVYISRHPKCSSDAHKQSEKKWAQTHPEFFKRASDSHAYWINWVANMCVDKSGDQYIVFAVCTSSRP